MARRILWLLVSCVMAVSLVVASCGTTTVEEEEEEKEEVVIGEEEEEEEEEIEEEEMLPPEVPKYGGVNTTLGGDPVGFDPAYFLNFMLVPTAITNEGLLIADWAKGPAGTGETDWNQGISGRTDLLTGGLAESYEFPNEETIIFHIRPGINWWDKPPVNGREFTAEDAAWSLNREWNSPRSWLTIGNQPEDRPTSIKALDKYTLEMKVPARAQGLQLILLETARLFPPELGDDIIPWEKMVGTGPYMITDYVVGSTITFERNPNYWLTDPVGSGKGNQLPYLDGLRSLIIDDRSTQQAAFRTGKLDIMYEVQTEDWELFMDQRPDLKYLQGYVSLPTMITGRVDKEELPFKDVRVRRAMNMAVNQEELLEDYYEGYGTLLGYLFLPTPAFQKMYVPLEEMPETVRELFEYKPDKAKQLLAEAGYPDGFRTKIICTPNEVDLVSVIREYLLGVGIDMEIQPLQNAVPIVKGRTHEEMCLAMTYPFVIWKMNNLRVESGSNPSFWDSPVTRETYDTVVQNVGKDNEAIMKALKDMAPHVLENAWGIWLPAPNAFHMWQPWVQNYHGESNVGSSTIFHQERTYIWMDKQLKASLGY